MTTEMKQTREQQRKNATDSIEAFEQSAHELEINMKPSDSQPLVDIESDQAKTIEQKGSNKLSQQMPKAKLFTSLEPANQQQNMNLKTDYRESTDDDLFYSARVSSDREHPNVRQMQLAPNNEGRT